MTESRYMQIRAYQPASPGKKFAKPVKKSLTQVPPTARLAAIHSSKPLTAARRRRAGERCPANQSGATPTTTTEAT